MRIPVINNKTAFRALFICFREKIPDTPHKIVACLVCGTQIWHSPILRNPVQTYVLIEPPMPRIITYKTYGTKAAI